MKKIFLCLFLFQGVFGFCAGDLELTSPDKNLLVEVLLHDKIYYRVSYKGEMIMQASPLAMEIGDHNPGYKPVLEFSETKEIDRKIAPVWGSRNKIKDHCHQLTLHMKGDYSVQFRAYNDGVAYRFVTNFREKEVTVKTEQVAYRFGFGTYAWMLDGKSYESNFHRVSLDKEITRELKDQMDKIFLPLIAEPKPGIKVLITEAGLYDYPALFLERGKDYEDFLNGKFEPVALTTTYGGFSNYSKVPSSEADYIARTSGSRNYPWRLMVISDDDRTFADCDLVYQLSEPASIGETDWIRPGKAAWEWWHDYVVEGEDFVGGINTKTYLYETDFAAKYGFEYIVVDWLWTDKYDLSLFNPDVDIKQVIDYAGSKGIGVILWCPAHTLYDQLDEALDLFAGLGAAGVKADFFGREDQTGIRMYEAIAKAAAKRKLLVDFHGCTKPTGLSRTYPNIINYEAVLGNEYNKISDQNLCSIEHKIILPFTRGMIGPMDFTPGGMRNRIDKFARFSLLPITEGTRSGEMALYVIYDEPLVMVCDAPSVYEREPDIPRFISGIPTSWDQTKVLEGQFGEYIVKARRKGTTWYVAGLNGVVPRVVIPDLSFLGEGVHHAEILRDGINAFRVGTDYKIEPLDVNANTVLPVKMEKGGGFILRIEEGE